MTKFFLVLLLSAMPLMAKEESKDHLLDVSGKGEVRIQASVADVRLGVEVEAKRSQDAQNLLSERVNKLLSALKRETVERLDTASFSVNPEYSNANPPEIKGYRGRAEISLRTGLDNAGTVIAHAMDAGATQVNGIDLKASDEAIAEARQEALRKACQSAMTAAQTVMNALSLEQRAITSVTIQPGERPPVVFRSKMATFANAMDNSTGPNLEGEQTVEAQVALQIEFREKN
jgi:uncharacterized protein YggE